MFDETFDPMETMDGTEWDDGSLDDLDVDNYGHEDDDYDDDYEDEEYDYGDYAEHDDSMSYYDEY